MNKKITEAFAKGKAFIPFVTCGDPSLDVTEKIVYAMEEAGADLIELGIPFSDPTAEGPVIQGANLRALSGGVTTDKVFDMVEKIRKNSSIPMVFMTYANVVFSYGIERFCKRAAEVGMDGMILPDVPFEEKEEFASVAEKYGLNLISLIAPTSHERISMIAKEAEGFVYCVSSLGVTGMRSQITTDIGAMVELVKAQKDIPCAVGFGISTPEQAKKMAVEQARSLITRLEDRIEAKFRVGIGRVREMQEMERSYREALRALNGSKSRVIHIEDLSQNGVYDEEFPVEMEKNIFRYLEEGKEKECIQEINVFFDWMVAHYADDMNNIRLKTLEYIIWGEKKAFEAGAINYGFSYRRDYLDAAMACTGYEELRKWFLDKMVNACRAIRDQKEDQSNSAAKKAMLYIQENYNKDISLDDVSGIVNISPYYFSKIFKEETGENFIEYVTKVRIEKAKEFLAQPDISIKEAGIRSGYTDPNYFSRIFKKQTDMTPSEYKTMYGK